MAEARHQPVDGAAAQGAEAAESPDDEINPRYMVPGLSRGLAMLALFTRTRPRQTLQELASGLGVTRSAAYRLAYTLEKDGFIVRDDKSRQYALTVRATSFGFEYLGSQEVVALAAPILRQLSETINASAYLVERDGYHAVYILRIVPSLRLVSNLQIGTRTPLHITASGRMLLACQSPAERMQLMRTLHANCRDEHLLSSADLEERAQKDSARGYVYRPSPIDPSVTSCAAPIRGMFGAVTSAITVIGPSHAMAAAGGEKGVSALVTEAAGLLSTELGYRSLDSP